MMPAYQFPIRVEPSKVDFGQVLITGTAPQLQVGPGFAPIEVCVFNQHSKAITLRTDIAPDDSWIDCGFDDGTLATCRLPPTESIVLQVKLNPTLLPDAVLQSQNQSSGKITLKIVDPADELSIPVSVQWDTTPIANPITAPTAPAPAAPASQNVTPTIVSSQQHLEILTRAASNSNHTNRTLVNEKWFTLVIWAIVIIVCTGLVYSSKWVSKPKFIYIRQASPYWLKKVPELVDGAKFWHEKIDYLVPKGIPASPGKVTTITIYKEDGTAVNITYDNETGELKYVTRS